MLLKLYYIVIILYLITFVIQSSHWRRTGIFTSILAVGINGVLLTGIILQSGHLPVFNIFESFLLITFIMGGVGLFSINAGVYLGNVRLWVWLEILVLLGITLFFPKQPSTSQYNHSYIYIILFHLFRHVALALMLYSTAYFVQFIIQKESDDKVRYLFHQGRNFLILSAVIFFMAEYVGIIWCLKGWGDFWSWSQNFLQSTMIVLYLMLAFHIPTLGRRSIVVKSMVGGLSGFVMLTLVIIRSFL
ncbi:hypothetical protein OAC89_04710 [Deltaproteobacteria bacterium]|nr:hypothetical protein [Deltaproteobacteria bacterium]